MTDLGAVPSANDLADLASRAARRAGAYLRDHFGRAVDVRHKSGYFDIVTPHDLKAERLITETLLAGWPDSTIVGEESGWSGDGRVRWYIDPIDGTTNFVAGLPLYAVSIGAEIDGSLRAGCVYLPQQDEVFVAGDGPTTLNGQAVACSSASGDDEAVALIGYPYEGRSSGLDEQALTKRLTDQFAAVRRLGSAALHLAYIAAGRGDVASELIAKPWDVAAGFHLVQRAGGALHLAGEFGTPGSSVSWREAPRYVATGANFDFASSSIAGALIP